MDNSVCKQSEILLPAYTQSSQIILNNKDRQISDHRYDKRTFEAIPFINTVVTFLSIKSATGFNQDFLKVLPGYGNEARQSLYPGRDFNFF
jgi:hypothetical protein